MKVRIAYHPHTDKDIETIAIVEAQFVHTRGIDIGDVLVGFVSGAGTEGITIYPTTRPYRIDQQGDTVHLLDKEFADRHPEPFGLMPENTKLFGVPVTVC